MYEKAEKEDADIVICDMVNSYNLIPSEIILQYKMHYPNIEYQKLGFAY